MRLSTLSAAAVLALAAVAARADVVYDTTQVDFDFIGQQTGQNYYYIGQAVSPSTSGGQLATISIPFGVSSAGSAFTYTPDISLDLYNNTADANARTGSIGSAHVNNVTFTDDGVLTGGRSYNFEDTHFLTFNFLSQGITLPSSFVFAYHDNLTSGVTLGAQGFSVGLTDAAASVGSSHFDTFDTAPNGGTTAIDFNYAAGVNIDAQITTVPLPTSATAGLVLIGLIGATTATKRLRRA